MFSLPPFPSEKHRRADVGSYQTRVAAVQRRVCRAAVVVLFILARQQMMRPSKSSSKTLTCRKAANKRAAHTSARMENSACVAHRGRPCSFGRGESDMKQQVRVSEVVSKCSDPEMICSKTPVVDDGLFSCGTETKAPSILTNQSRTFCVCEHELTFVSAAGSLLDFLKDGEGRGLKLPNLVDMAAQVSLDQVNLQ